MWKKILNYRRQFDDQDLLALESSLSKFSQESLLSESQKSLMKTSLLESIGVAEGNVNLKPEWNDLAEKIQQSASGKILSNYQKNLIYKGVLASISEEKKKALPWFWAIRNWQASVASALVFAILIGTFAIAPFELRVTRASKWTFLDDVQGEVFVNRDGKIMAVDKNFSLEQGDLIFTRAESFVSIRYLDDSVTRLGENTSLEISKLYVRPDNAVKTEVQLNLLNGQVWASVYNLIDNDSEFVVETENARANVNSRATFEVKSTTDNSIFTVFENVVDVSKKDNQVSNVQPVVAGFNAKINSSPFKISSIADNILVEKNSDEVDKWVITNLDLDKKHAEKLKEENRQFIASAVVSDQALGALADFKDSTKSIFTNTDVEKARERFLEVHVGFIKAQEYLDKADVNNDLRRQSSALLIQYKTAIKEIVENYQSMRLADPDQADKLLAQMKEEVDLQRKALSLVMPDEKLYTAKEVAMDAGMYFAINSAQKAEYMLDWSKNRLMETQTLVAKNDLKGAEATFRAYLRNLDDLVNEVEQSRVAEIEGSLFDLLNEQIKQFKTLTAIESELRDKGDQKFTVMVAKVKEDSLKKLVGVVKFYRKNGIPFDTINQLKNTTEEFFQDTNYKVGILNDLEQVMMDYPEFEQLKKQEVISNPGDVSTKSLDVIVDFEATRDLNINKENIPPLNVGGCASECAEEKAKNT